jgi:hypothetical protein
MTTSHKKKTKPKANPKLIKELVTHFEADLAKSLPIAIQSNGDIVYKNYFVRKLPNQNWGMFRLSTHDLIEEFYLRTSALLGARYHNVTNIEGMLKVKRLDNRYWSNYSDSLVFEHNIKRAKDFDRYLVLLDKLEYSRQHAEHYKEEISRMFKWSFV